MTVELNGFLDSIKKANAVELLSALIGCKTREYEVIIMSINDVDTLNELIKIAMGKLDNKIMRRLVGRFGSLRSEMERNALKYGKWYKDRIPDLAFFCEAERNADLLSE